MNNDTGAPDGLAFTITRTFDAPPDRVFQMWSDPAHFSKWCVPSDIAIADQTMDFREGGGFGSTMTAPDGTLYRPRCTYTEIVENERIVFTHAWLQDDGAMIPQTIVTVTFKDMGGRTELTLQQAPFTSQDSRDGHREGWAETLDGLAAYLPKVAATAA